MEFPSRCLKNTLGYLDTSDSPREFKHHTASFRKEDGRDVCILWFLGNVAVCLATRVNPPGITGLAPQAQVLLCVCYQQKALLYLEMRLPVSPSSWECYVLNSPSQVLGGRVCPPVRSCGSVPGGTLSQDLCGGHLHVLQYPDVWMLLARCFLDETSG